jgi:ubiquinone/menaquinone biosynthesis C-methylase UbiE
MNQKLKSIIKKVVPKPVIYRMLPSIRNRMQLFGAKRVSGRARLIFEQAGNEPAWLDYDMIEFYQQQYPTPPLFEYTSENLAKRGQFRAERLLNLMSRDMGNTFLELGCWDGMVSHALQCRGKTTVAIDNRSKGFDERAKHGGAKLLQMDACHLQFEDQTFDVVFSYNAFEHFTRPQEVLLEAIRVVKTGGYIFLQFGPLYMSPMGAHLYRQITIPYCHLLFAKDLLQGFANIKGLGDLDFGHVNGYTIEDFRKLWIRYSERLKSVLYYEMPDTSHIDLIEKHPSCFKNKTKDFDNLIISHVEVLFRKMG